MINMWVKSFQPLCHSELGAVELRFAAESRKQTTTCSRGQCEAGSRLSRVRFGEFALLLLLDQKPACRHLHLCHLVELKNLSRCLFVSICYMNWLLKRSLNISGCTAKSL